MEKASTPEPGRVRGDGITPPSGRLRVAFLYNHDAPHQIAHSVMIARELARSDEAFDVHILATSQTLIDHARRVLDASAPTGITYLLLPENRAQAVLGRIFDRIGPFSRIANLWRHRRQLTSYDALVVPERTTLILRHLTGRRTPRMIYTRHGSGDRSIGFKKSAGKFDLVLFSGPKTRDRFLKAGYLRPEQTAIVGYPKFDTVDPDRPRRLFDNDRPTVVYCPNPDPALSSFYRFGLDILEHFYQSDKYNLVFAPHVMLFKKKLHISLESFTMRWRPGIPKKYYDCPHILIDTGSPALMDMTYMLAADMYLGDVSSQVYEFMLRPRPCVFLNAHGADWQGNPNYQFWTMGPVVSDLSMLDRALEEAKDPAYDRQRKVLFAQTFDMTDEPSSTRAAAAIAEFLLKARPHPTA
ncbi:MAG: hypothetical protein D6763_05770 [Alphaproteobacteria bacterium]|nr:MAG: hypothetical protein D6763_05770 [Alphaproteobacteria bacterium]